MTFFFDSNGNPAPYGIIEISLEGVQEAFVLSPDYRTSKRRAQLFEDFNRYLHDFSKLVDLELKQWLDGSFTTRQIDPNDLDLVNFVTFEVFEKLLSHPDFWKFKTDPFGGTDSKTLYNVDAYFVPLYPEAHPLRSITEERMAYWEKEFGTDRHGNPKAIFELILPTS